MPPAVLINTEITEAMIFVKCRECRDFTKMPCFCRVCCQNALFYVFTRIFCF